MLGNKPPYTTMQQLNLDWVLSKLKTLLRLVPDDGAVGQILRRTRDGAVWSDEQGGGGGGAVQSVNGQTGAVVLDAADVGALPDDYTPPVTSVNGKTGAVVLGKSDVGLSNVDNVKQYSATNPPPYPVTSVNGQTGAVTVSVPVQSVNGKTGAVVLDAAAVGALPNSIEIKIIHVDVPYSMPANGNAAVNIKQLIDATMPAGYRFLGFSSYSTGYQRVFIINLNYVDNNFSLYLSSMNSATVSATFGCDVLITNLEE